MPNLQPTPNTSLNPQETGKLYLALVKKIDTLTCPPEQRDLLELRAG